MSGVSYFGILAVVNRLAGMLDEADITTEIGSSFVVSGHGTVTACSTTLF